MYLLCRSLDLVRSNISFFEGSNSTGAKPYSRHSTLLSTGANVPVAPVESAPMLIRRDLSWTHRLKPYDDK